MEAARRIRRGLTPAEGLSLAAAPVFALMALLTRLAGDGAADLLCAFARDSWPIAGMAPMYALMSLFHLPPWMRLFTRRS